MPHINSMEIAKSDLLEKLYSEFKEEFSKGEGVNSLFGPERFDTEIYLRFISLLDFGKRLTEMVRLAHYRIDEYGDWVVLILSAQKLKLLAEPYSFYGMDHSHSWNEIVGKGGQS